MMTYFAFPIPLLKYQSEDIKEIIYNVFSYNLYDHCSLEGVCVNNLPKPEDYLDIDFGNRRNSYYIGRNLHEYIDYNSPKAYIREEMLRDFFQRDKSEFEIECFIAFVALKSIIQKDACKKITNEYLLARMAGHSKKCNDLPLWLTKYKQRYWMDKLKTTLQKQWGLKLYGRYLRGFYVSIKMTKKELIEYAEKRKNRFWQRDLSRETERIRKNVLADIYANDRTKDEHPAQQKNNIYK